MKIAMVIPVLLLCACASPYTPSSAGARAGSIPMTAVEYTQCLALSGGGIRSGSVSLGVMQRLHEVGELKNFQVVSAVSGGGYPLYGALLRTGVYGETLDEVFAEKGNYIESVDLNSSFMGTFQISNIIFFTLTTRLSTVLFDPTLEMRIPIARQGYGLAILKTFRGNIDYRHVTDQVEAFPLVNLAGRIPAGLPFPIFVASVLPGAEPPSEQHRYSVKDVFEMSPEWLGSETTGYWLRPSSDLSMLDAAITSGAAIDAPKLDGPSAPLPDWLKRIGIGLGDVIKLPDKSEVFVSDGGFADNQGVVPLVNRGCRFILAVDATSDDEVELATWKSLSQTTYLKDSLQESEINLVVNAPATAGLKSGWKLPTHVLSASAANGKTGKTTEIQILKLGIDGDHLTKYPEAIQTFATKQWNDDWQARPACSESGLQRRCAFPLESTGRQSFTVAEFRAYRCLGKFMVDEWLAKRGLTGDAKKFKPPPTECLGDKVKELSSDLPSK
jgi:hypothetical protein